MVVGMCERLLEEGGWDQGDVWTRSDGCGVTSPGPRHRHLALVLNSSFFPGAMAE